MCLNGFFSIANAQTALPTPSSINFDFTSQGSTDVSNTIQNIEYEYETGICQGAVDCIGGNLYGASYLNFSSVNDSATMNNFNLTYVIEGGPASPQDIGQLVLFLEIEPFSGPLPTCTSSQGFVVSNGLTQSSSPAFVYEVFIDQQVGAPTQEQTVNISCSEPLSHFLLMSNFLDTIPSYSDSQFYVMSCPSSPRTERAEV